MAACTMRNGGRPLLCEGHCNQLLIQTVFSVPYPEAQMEQEPFAASGNSMESG